MSVDFVLTRRVEFADTDLAGIMHFANFFRFMEAAEHAFIRSLGASIHQRDGDRVIGWPRVRAECEYFCPLQFEEEVEVRLTVAEVKEKSVTYEFTFRRVGEDKLAARGAMTSVCVAIDAGGLEAVPIPAPLAGKLREACAR